MELASAIEHTRLTAETTPADVDALCDEALRWKFHGVCVNPCFVERASRRLLGSSAVVVSVVGFPLGANAGSVKAEEARRAVGDGASELDMVIPIGAACARAFDVVRREVELVRLAAPEATLKAILETGHFDATVLTVLAEAAVAAGAHFLKTSTGFGPRGASVADIELLSAVARSRARVKASGGIRTREQAVALIAAGASRLGTSHGVALVGG